MSAPDFYFAVNEIFRHVHDVYGSRALEKYWQQLGRDYYRRRNRVWASGGTRAIAHDWRAFFDAEPHADVQITEARDSVTLDIKTCPAIHHLRACGRDVVPYFCEHCDHVCGAQAEASGYRFSREGGNGSCRQRFVRLTVADEGGV